VKEVLYAADRSFLERWLKEKSAAAIADIQAITDLWDSPIALPGTPEAVDKIYSLEGDTAHIAISGPLSSEGPDLWDLFWGYGGTSYQDITAALDRAKNDPFVKSVILDINSPGGAIDGLDLTWQAIRAVGKPIAAHAGSLLASAAYWLASGADTIYVDAATSQIGSIGVLVASYDWSKWEEKVGIREIIITSSNAPDKNPDIATEQGRDAIRSRLDALERIFYARVSEGRRVSAEHIAEHFGKGGLMVASDPAPDHEDAIRAGMIDGLLVDARFTAASPSGEAIPPAQAGTNQEGQSMDLSEFLAANPGAAPEVEALKAKAKAEGREEALGEQSALINRLSGVIASDSYPSSIKVLAADVLAGKKSIEAFDAAITVYDAQIEQEKSKAAQEETAALGALGADSPEGDSKAIDAAIKAEMNRRREKANV
jgi:ClpP class serine protease